MDTNKEISTNIGHIPLNDYLDIVAMQNGFDDYADMEAHGIHIAYPVESQGAVCDA